MTDDDLPTTTAATSKKESSATADDTLFGHGRYKFWALAAILLLAFWSMFTGTITLKCSAGNLNRISDDIVATEKCDCPVESTPEKRDCLIMSHFVLTIWF
ncbi:hypothetical protein Scep_019166 [Stephania cephalantha]|uniref:Uncharacterized protein n=1 Tax=Stephania cephalantha TaxID=152367 RepID=A0AAP0IAU2_9MAGN